MAVEIEGLFDEQFLVELMPRGRPFGGAAAAHPADVTQWRATGNQLGEERPHEFPRAHVLRLLLQPDDLAQRRVLRQYLAERDLREWIELLDADDRDRGSSGPQLAGDQIDGDLAAAQHQPRN